MRTKLCLKLILIFLVLGISTMDVYGEVDVVIHGFGGWSYGKTNNNPYLSGNKQGNYSHANFYLNVNANLSQRLSIISQIGTVQSDIDKEGTKFFFDYAFAQWSLSDSVKIRMGKVKHPFGIYGEVNKVGTLRPFYHLPQGTYGPHATVGEGVNGFSLTGSLITKKRFELSYDIYFGQLRADANIANICGFVISQNPVYYNDEIRHLERVTDDLVGGRLTIMLPVEGITLGVSGYVGNINKIEPEGAPGYDGPSNCMNFFFEFLISKILFRSEYSYIKNEFDMGSDSLIPRMQPKQKSFYVEAAVKLSNQLQVVARYDWFHDYIKELDMKIMPLFWQEYVKHRDIAFGFNYWFSPNLVIKLSYHMVNGIRYNWPEFDDIPAFLAGDFENKSNLIQLGTQFSF